ncbi:hypothetical protein KCU74_g2018, partial [Aureobasidium melanogenum]
MGLPSKDTPDSADTDQSYASITTQSTSKKTNSSESIFQPRSLTALSKPRRKRTQARVQIKTSRRLETDILGDGYLVERILSFLRDHLSALSKLCRVSKLFQEVGTQFLWSSATIKNIAGCVRDTKNLSRYASFVAALNISTSQELWPKGVEPRPALTRLKKLKLCADVLQVDEPQFLIPYLSAALQRLDLWTSVRGQQENLDPHLDQSWLAHIGTTCQSLTKLSMQSYLRVSSADLSTFFSRIGQLKALRLGMEMNSVLSDEVMIEVFSLPHLEDLSLDFHLDHAFVTALRNDKDAENILPCIKNLEVSFSEGEGLAPALLLAVLPTVEQLWLTLTQVTEGQPVTLHPATFEMLGLMKKLRALQVEFQPGMQITYNELAALSSLPGLKSVHIARTYRPGDPRTDDLLVSGHELATSLLGFSALESLWLSIMPARINATYDEAQLIYHRLAQVYPGGFPSRITLVVDEVASLGWPLFEAPEPVTVQVAASDLIWQASSKNFSPDPVQWAPRNLNRYIDHNGIALPLNKVVTNGVYNHLIDRGTRGPQLQHN